MSKVCTDFYRVFNVKTSKFIRSTSSTTWQPSKITNVINLVKQRQSLKQYNVWDFVIIKYGIDVLPTKSYLINDVMVSYEDNKDMIGAIYE